MPCGYDFQGVFDVWHEVIIFIEKDVAEPATNDKSYSQIEYQVLGCRADQSDLFGPLLLLNQKIGGYKAQDVHHPVPSHVDWTDGEKVGVYVGIWNHLVSPQIKGYHTRLALVNCGRTGWTDWTGGHGQLWRV